MRAGEQTYTAEEIEIVDRVRDQLGKVPDSSFEKLESPDYLVKMEGYYKGGKNGIPRATTVLDGDICQCAARTYLPMLRAKTKVFYESGGMERSGTAENEHHMIGYGERAKRARGRNERASAKVLELPDERERKKESLSCPTSASEKYSKSCPMTDPNDPTNDRRQ
jgi:hypothetical protein